MNAQATEILKQFAHGKICFAEAVDRLVALGFTRADAVKLVD